MSKFEYLKKYIGHNDLRGTYFMSLNEEEIKKAEQKLGCAFPTELRMFYQEIGYGILSCGERYPEMYVSSIKNDIIHPQAAVNFALGIYEWPDQEYYMIEGLVEDMLEPGDLPFFEIADSSGFMVMKLRSQNPNAVWYMGGGEIEDSFETFIHRLYYESPTYYMKNW